MVNIPLRLLRLEFLLILNWTIPFPEPAAPDWIVIQLTELFAVHAHPFTALTVALLRAPPVDEIFIVAGVTV